MRAWPPVFFRPGNRRRRAAVVHRNPWESAGTAEAKAIARTSVLARNRMARKAALLLTANPTGRSRRSRAQTRRRQQLRPLLQRPRPQHSMRLLVLGLCMPWTTPSLRAARPTRKTPCETSAHSMPSLQTISDSDALVLEVDADDALVPEPVPMASRLRVVARWLDNILLCMLCLQRLLLPLSNQFPLTSTTQVRHTICPPTERPSSPSPTHRLSS